MARALLVSIVFSSVVSAVVTLAVISVATPRAAEAQGSVVKAEWVGVVGADGVEQVRLQVRPTGGGQVFVLDPSGTRRVTAGTGGPPDAPDLANAGVSVYAIDGTQLARMGTLPGAGAGARAVVVNDQRGNSRIRLLVGADGTPSISVLDAGGNVVWSAP